MVTTMLEMAWLALSVNNLPFGGNLQWLVIGSSVYLGAL